ncbi:c(7)-type cytochrome triheme domain-containing protein [Polaromonas sp.]|uniref:c(7)-type cytochrome triheme domain-containing protein n=1 Tax=Polaromonas sp. TaxID=1869339 RepID=UPI0025E0505E|nr:c(7)-type cytochrome triheme domain-containing protein [Polaromonas sp.]
MTSRFVYFSNYMKTTLRWLIALFAIVCAALPLAYGQLRPAEIEAPPKNEFVSEPQVADAQPKLAPNKFYDPASPAYSQLQKSPQALKGFPRDKKGEVDWMKALFSGAIKPRADLTGSKQMEVLDLDIVMKNTKEMPYVNFPHNSHTQWLACSNCHDKIFVKKAGANPIDMTKIFKGEYCGTCHDRVAFLTFFSCERCHSIPHGETKAWW